MVILNSVRLTVNINHQIHSVCQFTNIGDLEKDIYWFDGGWNWISVLGLVDGNSKVQMRDYRIGSERQEWERRRAEIKCEGYGRQLSSVRSCPVLWCLLVNTVRVCENDNSPLSLPMKARPRQNFYIHPSLCWLSMYYPASRGFKCPEGTGNSHLLDLFSDTIFTWMIGLWGWCDTAPEV